MVGSLLTLWSIATSRVQIVRSFQHLSVQYEFGFWNETFYVWKEICAKMRISKMGENGGTTVEMDILRVLLNIIFFTV